MARPVVEVLTAVHDPARPLARALASAAAQRETLADLGADLRLSVVVHDTDPEAVRARVPAALAEQVRWSAHTDGIASPAGPNNRALAEATGDYVTKLDSDDVLEPGTLAGWYARARDTRADAVVASRRVGSDIDRTPLLRPGRRDVLDPVADGLAYRTASFGLFRLERLREIGFAYTGGHGTGEDIEPVLRSWFRIGRVAYPYAGPCYVLLDDMGAGRTTAAVGPLSRELGFLPSLLAQPWLRQARPVEQETIAVKLARKQLADGIARRVDAARTGTGSWGAADAECVATSRDGLADLSGTGLAALSGVETDLLAGAAQATSTDELLAAWDRVQAQPRHRRVLPVRPRGALGWSSRPAQFAVARAAARSGVFQHPSPPHGWMAALDVPGHPRRPGPDGASAP